MLKPFQIRDLHSPLPEQNAHQTARDNNDHVRNSGSENPLQSGRRHGVVQISAPEYDEIVSSHPRARLMYMDDDDGEIITVGSSIELSQRLDEPVNVYTLPRSPSSPPRGDSSPMHAFDIHRSNSVTELWKKFETRSSETSESSERPKSPIRQTLTVHDVDANTADAGQGTEDTVNSKKTTDSDSGKTFNNLRELWFQACNPPRLPLTELSQPELGTQAKPPVSSKPNVPSQSPNNRNGSSAERSRASDLIEFGLTTAASITAEGKRQAQEAGARLRGLRNLSAGSSSIPFSIPSFKETPFASHSPGNAFASDSVETRQQKGSSEAVEPAAKDESQPLLAAFKAEMAKIMEASGSSEDGTPQLDTTASSADQRQATNGPPRPAYILAHAVQNIVSGVELVGSELKSRVPEIERLERQLSQLQRTLPEHVGTTLQGAFTALESRVKNLANALHDASVATGRAADRVRQAQLHPAAEQAVDGLRTLAGEFGQISRTLFAAFEAECGRRTSGTQNESSTQNASAASQSEVRPQVDDRLEDSATNGPAPRTAESDQQPASHSGLSENENRTPDDASASNRTGKPDSQAEGLSNEKILPGSDRGVTTKIPPHPIEPDDQPPRRRLLPYLDNMQHSATGSVLPAPFNKTNPTPPPHPLFPRPFGQPHQPGHSHWSSYAHPRFSPPSLHRQLPRDIHINGPMLPLEQQLNQQMPQSANGTLFIGNVGFNVTEKTIQDVFASKGFLANVHLPIDSETGKHAGFGYVHFPSTYAAAAALAALQGAHIDGHAINLEFSDHCPINTLETPPKVPNGTRPSMATSANPGRITLEPAFISPFRHRQSWHPANGTTSEQIQKSRPFTAPNDSNPANRTRKGEDTTTHPPGDQIEVSMLDEMDEDPELSARYPSLLSGDSQRSVTSNATSPSVPGNLPAPDSDMTRFPPVSQLDAHILASQQCFARTKPRPSPGTQSTGCASKINSGTHDSEKKDVQRTSNPPAQAIPGSFPQDTQENREKTNVNSSLHGRDQLRRSNTVIAADPAARLPGPFDPLYRPDGSLRRSATERDPLRQIRENHMVRRPSRPADTIPSRPSSDARANTPGSFPVNNSSRKRDARPTARPSGPRPLNEQQSAWKQSAIDHCVTALLTLGYGSASDEGRQRLRVYAEAAGGRISDAIDMIEEERKAYAQQGSLI